MNKIQKVEAAVKVERYRLRSRPLMEIVKQCDEEIKKAKRTIFHYGHLKAQANKYLEDFQFLTQEEEPQYTWLADT